MQNTVMIILTTGITNGGIIALGTMQQLLRTLWQKKTKGFLLKKRKFL